ncbi:hypothetical protein DAERI_050004 [Deinococcus aerius]|uniref:Uncharacterized protein n=1 Tax=Deinococcus aerius TaxID=200253 RepID=A0A2I9DXL3_9DEIO|nr:hypothetical protein [Deinococcus aerius]GBF05495.1 hypothetical protein DAERI_050004 [Deinococcus aerius]
MDYRYATWLLDEATRTELLEEIILPIGKPAACALHRKLGLWVTAAPSTTPWPPRSWAYR